MHCGLQIGDNLTHADLSVTIGPDPGLTRFLEDGRLELDANPVENAIRPVALTRKNALFAGHEVDAENWALLASIIATCKLNDVNPAAYITASHSERPSPRPHRGTHAVALSDSVKPCCIGDL
jgi:transposase